MTHKKMINQKTFRKWTSLALIASRLQRLNEEKTRSHRLEEIFT